VALQNGYFNRKASRWFAGFPSGKAALDVVRRGEGDLATVADVPFMYAVAWKAAPLAVVAVISEAFRESGPGCP